MSYIVGQTMEMNYTEVERRLLEMFEVEPAAAYAPDCSSRHANGYAQSLGRICADKSDWIDANSGLISNIGKFLLDPETVNAFENSIKSGRIAGKVRIFGNEHAAVLNRLQKYLLNQPHVVSTIVVSHDGAVLTCCGKPIDDIDSLASWALCAYVNSRIAVQITGAGAVNHIVMNGTDGAVIISDFGSALLLTMTLAIDDEAVWHLLQKLDALLA